MLRLLGDFIADANGTVFLPPVEVRLLSVYCGSVSTAIVVIFTPAGFIVASDGMGNDGHGSTTLEEQKIFETVGSSWHLAYALSGLGSAVDDETGVDIVKSECQWIAEQLTKRKPTPGDLGSYADSFANALGVRLRGQLVGELSAQKPSLKVRIDFAGYYAGKPQMATREVNFTLDGVSITGRENDKLIPRPNDYSIVGSTPVAKLLVSGGVSELEQFRSFKKIVGKAPMSLQEAIDAASNYIGACGTETARKLDSYCQTIGGRTSVVTITPDGFKRVDLTPKS